MLQSCYNRCSDYLYYKFVLCTVWFEKLIDTLLVVILLKYITFPTFLHWVILLYLQTNFTPYSHEVCSPQI